MRYLSPRLGALCGILAVVTFSLLYSIAMSLDSEYTFGENYLSDLGVGPGAWAFNSGLIVAGLLLVPFSLYGFWPALGSSKLAKASVFLLALSGIFLVCIGVFTEDYDPIHYIVSISFFFALLAAMGFVTESLYRSKALGAYGWVASLGAFIVGLNLLLMGGTPLAETIAVIAAAVWGILISIPLVAKVFRS